MDNRLKVISTYIKPGRGFIDVGTDHGYLPAALAATDYPGNIIATDINQKPLKTAVATAAAAGVKDRIEFLCCDGLSLCPPDAVDTIVIAGMGGDLICRILDEAEWCMDRRYTFLLQPMTKPEILRYWLVNNDFELLTEDAVAEAGAIYQIIIARFGGHTRLSDSELFSGKAELATNRELFLCRVKLLIKRFEKALSGMDTGAIPKDGRYALYANILTELKETEKRYGDCK